MMTQPKAGRQRGSVSHRCVEDGAANARSQPGGTLAADGPAMRLLPCLFAPLALASLVAGCFDSYGPGGRPDAGGLGDYVCNCCGVEVLAGSAADCVSGICDPYCLFPPPDAGTDAPLDASCGPRPIDVMCFDHVPAGRPTTVSVALGVDGADCFCEQDVICTAAIIGDHVLSLSTSLCPLVPLCRACTSPASGTCTLPAMAAGAWRVVVNGDDAFALDVTPSDVLPEPADVCLTTATSGSCGAIWPPAGFDVGRACHDDRTTPGTRLPIRVYDACGGCTENGPCEVTVLEHSIHVSATRMSIGCELVCPPVCTFDEHVCYTPPLEAGSYTVAVDGLAIDEATTVEVGSGLTGTETCAGG